MKSGSIEYVPVYRTDSPARVRRRIWIDIDNSPHVPFFVPIIEALEEAGFEVVLTARNMYQVSELVKFFGLPCKVIGGHCGKNTLLKVLYNCARAVQLMPIALRGRIHLAASPDPGADSDVQAARHPHDHDARLRAQHEDWVRGGGLDHDARHHSRRAMSTRADRVLKYPGLKEDVYVPRFWPDPAILPELGVSPTISSRRCGRRRAIRITTGRKAMCSSRPRFASWHGIRGCR